MGSQSVSVPGEPSTKPHGHLWVGTAGFSYPDWEGPVYGREPPAPGIPPAGRLAWLSHFVDLVETNVSYYRIPAPRDATRWLEQTADRPGFRFTAKLWRGFTHGPERPTKADLVATRAFLDALA